MKFKVTPPQAAVEAMPAVLYSPAKEGTITLTISQSEAETLDNVIDWATDRAGHDDMFKDGDGNVISPGTFWLRWSAVLVDSFVDED